VKQATILVRGSPRVRLTRREACRYLWLDIIRNCAIRTMTVTEFLSWE